MNRECKKKFILTGQFVCSQLLKLMVFRANVRGSIFNGNHEHLLFQNSVRFQKTKFPLLKCFVQLFHPTLHFKANNRSLFGTTLLLLFYWYCSVKVNTFHYFHNINVVKWCTNNHNAYSTILLISTLIHRFIFL